MTKIVDWFALDNRLLTTNAANKLLQYTFDHQLQTLHKANNKVMINYTKTNNNNYETVCHCEYYNNKGTICTCTHTHTFSLSCTHVHTHINEHNIYTSHITHSAPLHIHTHNMTHMYTQIQEQHIHMCNVLSQATL